MMCDTVCHSRGVGESRTSPLAQLVSCPSFSLVPCIFWQIFLEQYDSVVAALLALSLCGLWVSMAALGWSCFASVCLGHSEFGAQRKWDISGSEFFGLTLPADSTNVPYIAEDWLPFKFLSFLLKEKKEKKVPCRLLRLSLFSFLIHERVCKSRMRFVNVHTGRSLSTRCHFTWVSHLKHPEWTSEPNQDRPILTCVDLSDHTPLWTYL